MKLNSACEMTASTSVNISPIAQSYDIADKCITARSNVITLLLQCNNTVIITCLSVLVYPLPFSFATSAGAGVQPSHCPGNGLLVQLCFYTHLIN